MRANRSKRGHQPGHVVLICLRRLVSSAFNFSGALVGVSVSYVLEEPHVFWFSYSTEIPEDAMEPSVPCNEKLRYGVLDLWVQIQLLPLTSDRP
jgi:hypothetical protein